MHPVFLSFSALSQERDRRLTVAGTTLRLRKVAQPFIFQEEMREVKKAVESLVIFEENLSSQLDTTSFDSLSSYHQLTKYETDPLYVNNTHEYYYLDFTNDERIKFLEETLDLRNIENDYIVNTANIENIEICLVNGIEIEKTMYYTESEILEKYNDIGAGR